MCESEGTNPTGPVKSFEIISYDTEKKAYTYYAVESNMPAFSAMGKHEGKSWHWMSERAAALSAYQFTMPALNSVLLASAMRWLMLLLIIGVTVWLLYKVYFRFIAGAGDKQLHETQ